MSSTSWTTTPALSAGALGARPATGTCAVAATPPAATPAPVYGTRVPSARLRVLTGGMPFGAGTDEQHIQNESTFGIHSPGRPLS
ncbi:hypothetical protein [Trujillonella humicola]|uniref:hypothetical protein n=1 Tax=Trujillonella humicola TaxID=3383699 RepID=UPI0039059273